MLNEAIIQVHITELTRQRDLLLEQNQELVTLVRAIPSVILRARLDTKAGKETVYDYIRAGKACAIRV